MSSGFSKRGDWLLDLELAVTVLILDIVLVSAVIPIFPRRKAAASATIVAGAPARHHAAPSTFSVG
ncbi:MAG: hypothetical protein WBM51_01305, partial [Pseudolabrys sp.]